MTELSRIFPLWCETAAKLGCPIVRDEPPVGQEDDATRTAAGTVGQLVGNGAAGSDGVANVFRLFEDDEMMEAEEADIEEAPAAFNPASPWLECYSPAGEVRRCTRLRCYVFSHISLSAGRRNTTTTPAPTRPVRSSHRRASGLGWSKTSPQLSSKPPPRGQASPPGLGPTQPANLPPLHPPLQLRRLLRSRQQRGRWWRWRRRRRAI